MKGNNKLLTFHEKIIDTSFPPSTPMAQAKKAKSTDKISIAGGGERLHCLDRLGNWWCLQTKIVFSNRAHNWLIP
jgi:hypothetical protein